MTLFGVPVPASAVRVILRPILGRGSSLPLYSAVLEEEVSETDIVVAVSQYLPFWQYIQARNIEPPATGLYSWKLRVTFIDPSGVEESVMTPEPVDFYCAIDGGGGGRRADQEEEAITRLAQAAMQAIRDVGTAATQMIVAGAAPAIRAIEAVEKMQQAELTFRDEAMASIAHLSNELRRPAGAAPPPPEPDLMDNLIKLGGLFVAVEKGLGYLKKTKGDPN